MDSDYYNKISDSKLQAGGYYIQKVNFFLKSLDEINRKKNQKLKILDIACNEGTLSKKYAKYGQVYGIDLNHQAISLAKKKGIIAKSGDVLEIDKKFKGNKFDVIIAGDIIEHIFDTDLLIEKIYKMLSSDGVLLLSTPNLVSVGRRFMALIGRNPYCEYSAEKNGINVGHIRYYTFADLERQLKNAGFGHIFLRSDTINLPSKLIDNLMVTAFPHFGRLILVKANKK